MGGQGGPIICDFATIHYLLTDKIPIYCLPLQYQFSDYLPDSDKWTFGHLDKCPITKRTALYNHATCNLYVRPYKKGKAHFLSVETGKSILLVNKIGVPCNSHKNV